VAVAGFLRAHAKHQPRTFAINETDPGQFYAELNKTQAPKDIEKMHAQRALVLIFCA
jgi:hypothetical protein